jgi:hypothetical protein
MWNAKTNANAVFRKSIKSVSGHDVLGLANERPVEWEGTDSISPEIFPKDDLEAVPSPIFILVVRPPEQPKFYRDDPELPFASATSLAFAGVQSLAAIVAGLTAALAFTFVLALARVLVRVGHGLCLQRHAGMRSHVAGGVGANREGTCQ